MDLGDFGCDRHDEAAFLRREFDAVFVLLQMDRPEVDLGQARARTYTTAVSWGFSSSQSDSAAQRCGNNQPPEGAERELRT